MAANSFDIPEILRSEPEALRYVLDRLGREPFDHVKSLALPAAKEAFRHILATYFNGELPMDQAAAAVEHGVQTPPGYRRIERWEERLVRSEASKLFTLGYGDYLLAQGEEFCYVPHNEFDESSDCLRLIAGRTFPIRQIQDNIYANYGLRGGAYYPTVPLHANCRHIITRVPK